MGEVCSCFSDEGESAAQIEQINFLQKDTKFLRSIYLGLSSQELTMKLNSDKSAVKWSVVGGDEFGELDLVEDIKKLKTNGHQGLQYVNKEGKVVFEVQAENTEIRDKWIISINEMLQLWEENPKLKPSQSISAKGTSNKAEYFKKREEEIKQREKEAAEKKQKYSGAGMKYTAIAMASRA
jgi:hypothetical protein